MTSDPRRSPYMSQGIPELVAALCDTGQVGSQKHAEVDGALRAKLTLHLAESIDKHERAASRLSNQLLVLNIILGIFTIAGTVLTIVAFRVP